MMTLEIVKNVGCVEEGNAAIIYKFYNRSSPCSLPWETTIFKIPTLLRSL